MGDGGGGPFPGDGSAIQECGGHTSVPVCSHAETCDVSQTADDGRLTVGKTASLDAGRRMHWPAVVITGRFPMLQCAARRGDLAAARCHGNEAIQE